MLAKRIIPCLDIKNGRVVKGVNFVNLVDAGDPVELGNLYSRMGADELVFLDITATVEKRATLCSLVKKISEGLSIPFTVGGGVRCLDDAKSLFDSGCDKISINTAAITHKGLIESIASIYGSQAVVIAIDARKVNDSWEVFKAGGRIATGLDALLWAKEVQQRGAGEILLTSMDKDGTKDGFDLELTKLISQSVSLPVIASGGAGCKEDFYNVFTQGCADAALAASVFHYSQIPIEELKLYLDSMGIPVRR